MLLTDYFRYPMDATWDIAKQSGVSHGVIRLPETKDFDLTNKSHWLTVYNDFMDSAYTVGQKVELIAPARFLFDAGIRRIARMRSWSCYYNCFGRFLRSGCSPLAAAMP